MVLDFHPFNLDPKIDSGPETCQCGYTRDHPVHEIDAVRDTFRMTHPFVTTTYDAANNRWLCHCGLPAADHMPRPSTDPDDDRPHDGDSALRRWWCDSAFDEADRTIAKMEQYGSMDLVHIGRAMWDVMGRDNERLTDVAAMEIGCLFYCYGKIQRAMSALKADLPILDDTWFDMHIYPKMAEAARKGVWPL